MTPELYLDDARRRLACLSAMRTMALVVAAALLVTAVLAWVIVTLVPTAASVIGMRIASYAGLVGLAAVLLWRPGSRERAARSMEARVPAFGGRLITWLDASRRAAGGSLFVLLAREISVIAARHPLTRQIPARQFVVAGLAAAIGLGLLAVLLVGSRPWQLAAQRLWAGDLFADVAPRIVMRPGDVVVRRGSDVVVGAETHGFFPDDMEVHATFGGAPWERAPMSRHGDASYGFVFVGVDEEIEYYVSARGITSDRHRIRVADLPRVTGVALTYRLPAWAGVADAHRSGGDVRALPGSAVDVSVTTDRPAAGALLVVNGVRVPLTADGRRLRAAFEVARPGSWHVAVPHQGELARISDSYAIEVAGDAAPEVAFTFPGADRKATPIEEVALQFRAEDDYRVESLWLRYAVNGGNWTEVALRVDGGRHLLALESLEADEQGARRPLRPGDVISLYGEARDHTQSTRTSLYFVDVRPFDRAYRESQQMGGQGGAEGGGLDIAERQRDILSATWNLINKREGIDARAVQDQADVLAMLQRTLREQVQTLLSRSHARGLGGQTGVSEFLREMDAALEHMEPAARRLETLAFAEAVPREQQALRHLVTAESSVSDVDVSLARDSGRGTSGRSLRELIELEMDPQRNRYEMPQQPGDDERAEAERTADWHRLEELAERQERLARQQAQNPASLPSRWEQARLQRELAELRREIEGQSGSAGAPAASSEGTVAELETAERALGRQDVDPRAREQAGESLRRAARSLREVSRSNLEQRLDRAGRQAANLRSDQARVMEALTSLQQSELERARNREAMRGEFAMQTFAAVKRRMQQDLADLRVELAGIIEGLDQRADEGARPLGRALRELDEVRVNERLSAAAEAFEMGQPLYVIASEAQVTQALARLGTRIGQARDAVAANPGAGEGEPLDRVRELRRRLAAARTGDGRLAGDEVATVARSLARLAPAAGGSDGAAGGAASRSGLDDGLYQYRIRGTASDNTATLYRMTLERLDLIEETLERAGSAPVRAQAPREPGRDSEAAARYFRELSTDHEDERR